MLTFLTASSIELVDTHWLPDSKLNAEAKWHGANVLPPTDATKPCHPFYQSGSVLVLTDYLITPTTGNSPNWPQNFYHCWLPEQFTNGLDWEYRKTEFVFICKEFTGTTIRYHLTPVRMALIKKSVNNKCWQRCEKKGTLMHCWWDCKLVQPLWKTVWRFFKKLKIEPYDPAMSILDIYQKNPY